MMHTSILILMVFQVLCVVYSAYNTNVTRGMLSGGGSDKWGSVTLELEGELCIVES